MIGHFRNKKCKINVIVDMSHPQPLVIWSIDPVIITVLMVPLESIKNRAQLTRVIHTHASSSQWVERGRIVIGTVFSIIVTVSYLQWTGGCSIRGPSESPVRPLKPTPNCGVHATVAHFSAITAAEVRLDANEHLGRIRSSCH